MLLVSVNNTSAAKVDLSSRSSATFAPVLYYIHYKLMYTEISFIDPDALQAFCEPSQRAPYAVCFGASTTAARLVSACVVAFSSQRMPKNVYS